jgi:type I restriction-modification system DNA methylase subunit
MELTNEEKKSIVMQHAKGIMINMYNLQTSLIEENSVSSPDQNVITNINSQLAEFQKKLDAMTNEIADLDAAIAAQQ